MRRAGVRDGWPVVVYDEADSTPAARAWWLLRYFGHDQVRVLDGGYRAWVAAGQPVETGPGPSAAPDGGTADGGAADGFTAGPAGCRCWTRPPRPRWPGTRCCSSRSAERYRGEAEPVDPVAGHIPGAISAPTTANVTADGTFLPGRRCRPGSSSWVSGARSASQRVGGERVGGERPAASGRRARRCPGCTAAQV